MYECVWYVDVYVSIPWHMHIIAHMYRVRGKPCDAGSVHPPLFGVRRLNLGDRLAQQSPFDH